AFPGTQKDTALDDWLAYHPDGYYDGSPGVERYLASRVGADLKTPDSVGVQLHQPDRLAAALKLDGPKAGSRWRGPSARTGALPPFFFLPLSSSRAGSRNRAGGALLRALQ